MYDSSHIPAPPEHVAERYKELLSFDHVLKLDMLYNLKDMRYSNKVNAEAEQEILRYKDEGLATLEWRNSTVAQSKKKTSGSKDQPTVFAGRGVMFTIFDGTKANMPGPESSTKIIERAIDEAIDNGHDDSESIARYITTHAFHHVKDRVARFNSVLKAGDVVGARITIKMFNALYDLERSIKEAETDEEKDLAYSEFYGFAEAMTIVLSPFSVEREDRKDHVDWDEIEHLTDLMIEQRKEQYGRA